MDLNYSVFFEIELLHEYYANQKCCDFEITPDADTKLIAKSLGLQWRMNGNRLVAMIRVNEFGEPFINRPAKNTIRRFYGGRNLRFLLRLKNPAFANFTNIALSPSAEKKIFYFSNYAANKKSGKLFLSEPIEEYHLNKTYVPGEFILDSSTETVLEAVKKHVLKKKAQVADRTLWKEKGLRHVPRLPEEFTVGKSYLSGDIVFKPGTEAIYECVRRHSAAGAVDLDDSAIWASREKGVVEYPGVNDAPDLTGSRYRFSMSAAVQKAEIEVFGYNPASSSFDTSVLAGEIRSLEEKTSAVVVDLSSLKPGRYKVVINKESRMIYYDTTINPVSSFGIVDIAMNLPGESEYSLLDEEEKLKAPLFTIHFANRQVLWKYIRKDGKAEAVTDTGETGYVFERVGDEFISTVPIPLSETVCKTLKLDFNTKDFRLYPLPNPLAGNLAKFRRDDYDYLCSEVYLNY